MKERSSHKMLRFKLGLFGVLLTLLALAALWAPLPHSTAQRPNRQLKIEPQPNAAGQRRIALVIGNTAYATSPLKNPANDATDMAASLKTMSFTVECAINLSQRRFPTNSKVI